MPAVYAALRDGTGPLIELPLYPDPARKLWATYPYFSTRALAAGADRPHVLLSARARPAGLEPARVPRRPVAHAARPARRAHGGGAPARMDRGRAARCDWPRWTPSRALRSSAPSTTSCPPVTRRSAWARSGSIGSGPAARGPAPCVPADAIDRSGWTVTASGEGDPDLVRDGDNAHRLAHGAPAEAGRSAGDSPARARNGERDRALPRIPVRRVPAQPGADGRRRRRGLATHRVRGWARGALGHARATSSSGRGRRASYLRCPPGACARCG